MNWKQIIKKINKEYPKLTPDKLYDFVEKTYGSKSDIKELKAEWVNIVIKSIKGFKGVPSSVDRKKLSLQKRINYFVNSKNFKFSWQLFHPHYYNDLVMLATKSLELWIIQETLPGYYKGLNLKNNTYTEGSV